MRSSVVERQLPKLNMRVRFPSRAPPISLKRFQQYEDAFLIINKGTLIFNIVILVYISSIIF